MPDLARKIVAATAAMALLLGTTALAVPAEAAPAPTVVSTDPAACVVAPGTAPPAANHVPVSGAVGVPPPAESPVDPVTNPSGSIQGMFTNLALNIVKSVAGKEAGWMFNMLLGHSGNQQPTPTEVEILTDITQMQTQLNGLQTQLSDLSTQLQDAENLILTQLAKYNYDTLVGSATPAIATMQTAIEQLCSLGGKTRPYTPTQDDVDFITGLRSEALQTLTTLSDALLGTNSDGILSAYSNATWDSLSLGANRGILTPPYVTAMRTILAYYVSLSTQFFNAYSEAMHWVSDASPGVNAVAEGDTGTLALFGAQLQQDINAWSMAATLNVPLINTGTVVDIRSTPFLQWTSGALNLAGGSADSYYCYTNSAECLYTPWTADGTVAGAGALVPNVASLQQIVQQAQTPTTPWRVPSTADWTTLVSNTPSPVNPNPTAYSLTGGTVAGWAQANGIGILEAQSVAFPTGPQSVVPPVVTSTAPANVLTFNGTTPAPIGHTAPTGATYSYAGALAIVAPISPVVPIPTTQAQQSVPAQPVSATTTTRVAAAVAPTTAGTLNVAAKFSSAASCGAVAYSVPLGANAVTVTLVGGNGGSTKAATGGKGGTITATVPVHGNSVLYVQVGAVGGTASTNGDGEPGVGGGGGGGSGGYGQNRSPGGFGGAGGGGASGISFDPTCGNWIALAGGGGGGGGYVEEGTGTGGPGGSTCLITATTACAGVGPTKTGGAPATTDGAGGGGTWITGGAGGTLNGKSASPGAKPPTSFAGGAGGNASTDPDGIHTYYVGGGGGGGGGGWGGGGGGGAGYNWYNGAGGAAGASYVVNGVAQNTFAINNSAAVPVVTITPVIAAEYMIGLTPGDGTGLNYDGVMDNYSNSPADGNPILRNNSNGGPTQTWGLVSTGQFGQYRLANGATQKCLSYSTGEGQLEDCTATSNQAVTFTATGRVGLYQLTAASGQALAGTCCPGGSVYLDAASSPPGVSQLWGLITVPSGIWAVDAAHNGPHSVAAQPDPVNAPASDQPQLAATGSSNIAAAALGSGMLLLGALLIFAAAVLRRPRRRVPPQPGRAE